MKYASLFFVAALALGASCKKPDSAPNPTPVDTTKNPAPITYDTTGAFATTTADLAVYEAFLRSQGSAGTFQTFVPQLDSIKRLGMNTVWFMPLFPIGQYKSAGGMGSPYAPMDYLSVNPEFGTAANFKALVAAAHTRKLNVVVDWVANHTSWDHAWISAHPDWYEHDGSGAIIGETAQPTWQDIAALNYNNADMRLAMIGAMKYWVTEFGVDGFRCDAADYVPTSFWKQAIDSLEKVPTPRPLILFAEGSKIDQLQAGFQMLYGWNFFSKMKSVWSGGTAANTIYAVHAGEYNGLPAGKQRLRYTTNHDETAWNQTPIELFGSAKAALTASVITVTMGGVPLIYNGQEVGDPQHLPLFSTSSINWSLNPGVKEGYRKLLQFRKTNACMRTGLTESYASQDIVIIRRRLNDAAVLVLANIRNADATATLPTAFQNKTYTNLDGQTESLGTTVVLPAYGYKILK